MAETNTTQAAKLVANQKLAPHESHGRVRTLSTKMPAAYAQLAINDTIFLGRVPVNARFLLGSRLGTAAGNAGCTLDIGLRKSKDGTVINAAGIATGIDVAAAGNKDANNGALIANGAEYVTTEEVEVYATVKGAVLAANQVLKFEIPYVVD